MAQDKLQQMRYYLWKNSKHDIGMDMTPGEIIMARHRIRDAYPKDEIWEGLYDVSNGVTAELPHLGNDFCSRESRIKAMTEQATLGLIIAGRPKKDLAAFAESVGLEFNPKMVVPYVPPREQAISTSS